MTPSALWPLRYRLLAASAIVCAGAAAGQSFNATANSQGATVDQTVAGRTVVTVTSPTAVIFWTPKDGSSSASVPIVFQNAGTTATFTGQSNYTVLNSIAANAPIQFDGTVQSFIGTQQGGNLWFYSPYGIVLGPTARFDVGGLLLTTAAIPATNGGFDERTTAFGGNAIALIQPDPVIIPGQQPTPRPSGSSTGIPDTQQPTPATTFTPAPYIDNVAAPYSANATITLQPGSRQPQVNARGYVALIAPRIDMAGSVSAAGEVVYASGDQGTITFPFGNSSLFSIAISRRASPTLSGPVISHTGSTTGPGRTASVAGTADLGRNMYVVVAQAPSAANGAITALLGGTLGYDAAAAAYAGPDDTVILSGSGGAYSPGATPTNVIANGVLSNQFPAVGTAGDGVSATIAGGTIRSQLLARVGNLTIDAGTADVGFLRGVEAYVPGLTQITVGSAAATGTGRSLSVGDSLVVRGLANAAEAPEANRISVSAQRGALMTVGGGLYLNADQAGRGPGDTGPTPGDNRAGAIRLDLIDSRLRILGSGRMPTGLASGLLASARGTGADGSNGGRGIGGSVALNLSGSDLTVQTNGIVRLDAGGVGGNATGSGGAGGTGIGGSATVALGTGTVTVAQLEVRADAAGGTGTGGSATSGGAAGGGASVLAENGGRLNLDRLTLDTAASVRPRAGGGIAPTTPGAALAGGRATVSARTTGAITVAATSATPAPGDAALTINSGATGGTAAAGGSVSTGGGITLTAQSGGTLTTRSAALTSNAQGGSAIGGDVAVQAGGAGSTRITLGTSSIDTSTVALDVPGSGGRYGAARAGSVTLSAVDGGALGSTGDIAVRATAANAGSVGTPASGATRGGTFLLSGDGGSLALDGALVVNLAAQGTDARSGDATIRLAGRQAGSPTSYLGALTVDTANAANRAGSVLLSNTATGGALEVRGALTVVGGATAAGEPDGFRVVADHARIAVRDAATITLGSGNAAVAATGGGGVDFNGGARIDAATFGATHASPTAGGDTVGGGTAGTSLTINASGGITAGAGTRLRGDTVSLNAGGSVQFAGNNAVTGAGTVRIQAAGDITAPAAGGAVAVTAGGGATLAAGNDLVAPQLSLTGRSVALAAGRDLRLASVVASGGAITGTDAVPVSVGRALSIDRLAAGGTVDMRAPGGIRIGTAGIADGFDLLLDAGGSDLGLTNAAPGASGRARAIVLSGRAITAGTLAASRDVTLTGTGAVAVTTDLIAPAVVARGATVSLKALGALNIAQGMAAAGDFTAVGNGTLQFGTTTATGTVTGRAAGTIGFTGITGARIDLRTTAGDIVGTRLGASGAVTLDGVGTVATRVDGGAVTVHGGSIALTAPGALTVAAAEADGDGLTLRSTGDLTLVAGSARKFIDAASTGGALSVGDARITAPVGTLAVTAATPPSTGAITLAAATSATLNGTVSAAGALDVTGTTIAVNGATSGGNATFRSGAITLGPAATVGSAGIVTFQNSGTQRTQLGGTTGSGYLLTQAAFDKVRAGSIAVIAPAAGQGAAGADVTIADLTLRGNSLAAKGSFSVTTPGQLQVTGNLLLADAGANNAIRLTGGRGVGVTLPGGLIRVAATGGAAAGVIDLTAPRITAATSAALADVTAAPTATARIARLASNDTGTTGDAGAFSADRLVFRVSDALYIQNTGGVPLLARRGFSAGAGGVDIVATGAAPAEFIVNGRIGASVGESVLGQLRLTGPSGQATAAGFTGASAANDCRLVGGCPTVDLGAPAQDVVSIVTALGVDDPRGVEDAVHLSLPLLFAPLIDVLRRDPLGYDPPVEEAVTGAGNDSLWTGVGIGSEDGDGGTTGTGVDRDDPSCPAGKTCKRPRP